MSTTNTSLFPLPPLYYKKYTDPPISVISTHDKPHEYTLKHQSAYSTQLLPPIPIIGEYSSFGVKYNTATTSAVNQPEFTYQSLKDQLTIITTEFSNVLKFDDVKKIDILNESIKHFHVILNSFRSLQVLIISSDNNVVY